MTKEEREMAIGYFKFHRNIFCDDHLKICPKNSIAYQATIKEKSFYDMAITALEQEPVLDKIRAEIDEARFIDKDTKLCKNANASGLEVAMQIIDKYKAESEVQNES